MAGASMVASPVTGGGATGTFALIYCTGKNITEVLRRHASPCAGIRAAGAEWRGHSALDDIESSKRIDRQS
jgi:hypothetical protein